MRLSPIDFLVTLVSASVVIFVVVEVVKEFVTG
jgi:hypothetical protein